MTHDVIRHMKDHLTKHISVEVLTYLEACVIWHAKIPKYDQCLLLLSFLQAWLACIFLSVLYPKKRSVVTLILPIFRNGVNLSCSMMNQTYDLN